MKLPDGKYPELTDLAFELARCSAELRSSLPTPLLEALSELVRAMNCYYSNLIEGHNTHPVDIERALANDYSEDREQRDLQLEARAHVLVQQWIDKGNLSGRSTTIEGICEVHRRFYEHLPDELLWIENPETRERVQIVPGELRKQYVKVGNHMPVSPEALTRFMERFESVYTSNSNVERVLTAAAAHHRLLWIHPFLDGNGRVARLMSYATMLDGLNTGGIWSISRGLARQHSQYKAHLMECDLVRQGDTDGRGARSQKALARFTEFFLLTCIDQVKFMADLIQPNKLNKRIMAWAQDEVCLGNLSVPAPKILQALLYRGEISRSEIPEIVGTTDRQARRYVTELRKFGVIQSTSTRAPLQIAFPANLASRWMPSLFPEQ
ncbi:Fic family protein [Marinobacterium sp. xm-d-564]|uniref:Fic family protein n=1 Tax=Marinobacterium sp. xm-d-564 TaxID=2497742 RepID=UPI0015691926|nr:Fic family protein [Marinobacterium sp. xm-d-564]NRP59911.1 Fic/DOC family protein [Marinobacterium sp. xm-d-564]